MGVVPMTDDELQELVRAASALLRPRMERSQPLRRVVRLIGQWLVEESVSCEQTTTDSAAHPATDAQAQENPAVHRPSMSVGPTHEVATPPDMTNGVVPLKLGDETVELPVEGTLEEGMGGGENGEGTKEGGLAED